MLSKNSVPSMQDHKFKRIHRLVEKSWRNSHLQATYNKGKKSLSHSDTTTPYSPTETPNIISGKLFQSLIHG